MGELRTSSQILDLPVGGRDHRPDRRVGGAGARALSEDVLGLMGPAERVVEVDDAARSRDHALPDRRADLCGRDRRPVVLAGRVAELNECPDRLRCRRALEASQPSDGGAIVRRPVAFRRAQVSPARDELAALGPGADVLVSEPVVVVGDDVLEIADVTSRLGVGQPEGDPLPVVAVAQPPVGRQRAADLVDRGVTGRGGQLHVDLVSQHPSGHRGARSGGGVVSPFVLLEKGPHAVGMHQREIRVRGEDDIEVEPGSPVLIHVGLGHHALEPDAGREVRGTGRELVVEPRVVARSPIHGSEGHAVSAARSGRVGGRNEGSQRQKQGDDRYGQFQASS